MATGSYFWHTYIRPPILNINYRFFFKFHFLMRQCKMAMPMGNTAHQRNSVQLCHPAILQINLLLYRSIEIKIHSLVNWLKWFQQNKLKDYNEQKKMINVLSSQTKLWLIDHYFASRQCYLTHSTAASGDGGRELPFF